jgi:small subunit ribosomal protein S19
MSRSIWKGPFVHTKLFKDIKKTNKKPKSAVETVSRCSQIIPGFIGTNFDVYNGKSFLKIEITKEIVGFKLGEFSPTRKKFSFKKKKKK